MRALSTWFVCALVLPGVAWADDLPEPAQDDSLASWIDRLDGEAVPEEAEERATEAARAELGERAFLRSLHGLDVPTDYYTNPLRALTGDPLMLDQLDLATFDLPIEINEHVEAWMRILLGRGRGYFKKWLERKARFEPMIYAKLDEAGLPRDLIYLAMIESGFNTHALSHASAGGLWQFIPSTGRMYGLDIDFWLDERRDPEMATEAALQMLGKLNHRFDDWWLAFAAYNTGPARVSRALGRAPEGADYWTLLDEDLLHRETAGYVPKIIAAAIIGHHPERYGFTDLEPEPPLVYDSVYVEDGVDVEVLADCAGLDEDGFRALNPMLRRYAIPDGGVDLRVPVGTREAFLAKLDAVPPSEKRKLVMHRVSKGETLSTIARRYSVSQSAVQTANKLRNANHLSIGQKLIIPVAGRSSTPSTVVKVDRDVPQSARANATTLASIATPPPATASSTKVDRPSTYTVASGDALSKIAERYDVPLASLQRWNNLSNASAIQVGQVLRLSEPGAATAPAEPTRTYTVKAGDTLSEIATRHAVSMAEIQRWNGISDASSLRVGRTLRLYGGAAPVDKVTTTYVVRSGDTLSGIAAKHDVSIADIQRANSLSGTGIQVGQRLTVPGSAMSWTSHTVASGESLGLIANRYKVSVADLKAWNKLKNATIYPGDVLKVRTGR